MDNSGVDKEVEEGVSVSKSVFSSYLCRSSVKGKGCPHPGDIAEAASLSAVSMPETSYPLWSSLPEDLIRKGRLSQLQLEGILYACSQHQKILPTGERAGFFIGDGAGVGKGRQIAGIVIDSFARGRRQAVWVSISTDLHLDAQRDFLDLGCHINIINNCQSLDKETKTLGLSKDFKEGVLFMTYSTLTSSTKGRSRMQQVEDWLGGPSWDGVLVFDECHKAKNFSEENGGTKVAAAVIELQKRLPRARVLYCSATGVSEVANMAYMTRMGLWGPCTAFLDFDAFLDNMKKRGVSFMEMLAMEMKAEGKYVARGLSFKDAEFTEVEAQMDASQAEVYDQAVRFWRQLKSALEEAEPLMPPPSSSRKGGSEGIGGVSIKDLGVARSGGKGPHGGAHAAGNSRDCWKAFYSTQQRFFKSLCVSMKVPTVISHAKKALSEGMCVVIGLQSTGEAAADALALVPGEIMLGFVSPTKEMLHRFVSTYFPVRTKKDFGLDSDILLNASGHDRYPALLAGDTEMEQQIAHDPDVINELQVLLEELHVAIDKLQLPPNFLDILIDELGGPNKVAEMTGRKGRTVRGGGGRLSYELRARPETVEMDSLNVRERDAFMSGKKLVAIISDAASTGISLHASLQAKNRLRRVHLTIELPWSADKAIQQLGRTHRSNQERGPLYKLVVTQVGGEKRFAAAVARRLQSLGALTRGDRRAASGVDLSASNVDTPLGRKSLRKLYDLVVTESGQLPSGVKLEDVYRDHPQASCFQFTDPNLERAHICHLHHEMRQHCKDVGDVRRFLNRILGLPLVEQNLLFNYFSATLVAEIRLAKAEGKYSEGLSDLHGRSVQLVSNKVLWTDPKSGLVTRACMFSVDRGVSYQDAKRRLHHDAQPDDNISGFRRARRPVHAGSAMLLAIQRPGQAASGGGAAGESNVFTIYRPNTGVGFDLDRDELDAKYVPLRSDDELLMAEREWTQTYEGALRDCIHGPDCRIGKDCMIGRRMTSVTVLSGSVVRVWSVLEAVLSRHERELNRVDRALRVVRVEMDSGEQVGHLVGVRFPGSLISEVQAMLRANELLVEQQPFVQQQQRLMSGTQQQRGKQRGAAPSGTLVVEPPTAIDLKSLRMAFQAPKVITDFFRRKETTSGPSLQGGPSQNQGHDKQQQPIRHSMVVTPSRGKSGLGSGTIAKLWGASLQPYLSQGLTQAVASSKQAGVPESVDLVGGSSSEGEDTGMEAPSNLGCSDRKGHLNVHVRAREERSLETSGRRALRSGGEEGSKKRERLEEQRRDMRQEKENTPSVAAERLQIPRRGDEGCRLMSTKNNSSKRECHPYSDDGDNDLKIVDYKAVAQCDVNTHDGRPLSEGDGEEALRERSTEEDPKEEDDNQNDISKRRMRQKCPSLLKSAPSPGAAVIGSSVDGLSGVEALMNLGVSRREAQRALFLTHGDANRAAEMCFK